MKVVMLADFVPVGSVVLPSAFVPTDLKTPLMAWLGKTASRAVLVMTPLMAVMILTPCLVALVEIRLLLLVGLMITRMATMSMEGLV